jgi:hypothetical protein
MSARAKRDDVKALPISEERRRISDLEHEVQRLKIKKEILKKGYCSSNVGLNERFTLVDTLKESCSMKSLCQLFEVHRSSYGYWKVNTKKIRVEDLHADIEVNSA